MAIDRKSFLGAMIALPATIRALLTAEEATPGVLALEPGEYQPWPSGMSPPPQGAVHVEGGVFRVVGNVTMHQPDIEVTSAGSAFREFLPYGPRAIEFDAVGEGGGALRAIERLGRAFDDGSDVHLTLDTGKLVDLSGHVFRVTGVASDFGQQRSSFRASLRSDPVDGAWCRIHLTAYP